MKRGLELLLKSKTIIFLILLGASLSLIIMIFVSYISLIHNDIIITYITDISSKFINKSYVFSVFIICIIGPVFEELVFRGGVLKVTKRIISFKYANVLQAILFGLQHLNIIQISYTFIIGLIIGYVYNKYKTIYAPILIHISINSIGFILPLILNNILFNRITNLLMICLIYFIILNIGIIIFWISFKKIYNYSRIEEMDIV